jgi:hypothetical protein
VLDIVTLRQQVHARRTARQRSSRDVCPRTAPLSSTPQQCTPVSIMTKSSTSASSTSTPRPAPRPHRGAPSPHARSTAIFNTSAIHTHSSRGLHLAPLMLLSDMPSHGLHPTAHTRSTYLSSSCLFSSRPATNHHGRRGWRPDRCAGRYSALVVAWWARSSAGRIRPFLPPPWVHTSEAVPRRSNLSTPRRRTCTRVLT